LILEKYYDQMFRIVANSATSFMSVQMKNDVMTILKKYGKNVGCESCNGNIIQMMTDGCSLYIENKHLLTDKKDESVSKTKKQRNAK